ncbi:MAG: phosphatase [Opitutaceae bacterium]|jgi:exopolyphosphatase/guanosine-5'-triphosphate,3'-diphosphate pyrophosphatase
MRISRGIGKNRPMLSEEGMINGIQSIKDLVRIAAMHSPSLFDIVATSAVRGAGNGVEFSTRVQESCGLPLRILSGDEEALLIGRGLACDPELSSLGDFFLFDLGGGSLECLSFVNRLPVQAISLPLGSVRLTEKFVSDATSPVGAPERDAIAGQVRKLLSESKFRFSSAGSDAVFTGGSMTTARVILTGGTPLSESSPRIPVPALRDLAGRVCGLPLSERSQAIPGLPQARADIFPAALVTMLAIADAGGFGSFLHSFHNLRYGLAAELLEKTACG